MPKKNYTPVYGLGDTQPADSPNSGRQKWNSSINDLDTRTAAVEDRFDSGGLLLPQNLPSLAISDTYTVASQAAMLALSAQRGDVAVRTDLLPNGSFILAADDPTVLSNWVQISFASAAASGGSVPAGGAPGQSLRKNTATDYDVGWATPHEVPAGGAAGQVLGKNSATDYDVGWVNQQAGGGGAPAWMNQSGAGSLFGLAGDGNPGRLLMWLNANAPSLTPTQLGTTTARTILFRLPKTVSVSALYLLSAGTVSNLLRFAIYPEAAGSNKVWESGAVPSVSQGGIITLTASTPFALAANTNYWFCTAATSTSATFAVYALYSPRSSSQYGANAAPFGGRAIGLPIMAQFACSAGVFPATLPAIAAASYDAITTGPYGVPIAFLEGTAS